MEEKKSRMEKLYENAETIAKQGKWEYQTKLYDSEVKTLILREHLDITILGERNTNSLHNVRISWKTAFNNERITKEQLKYLGCETDIFPRIKNFAQKLAIETYRAIQEAEIRK